MTAEPPRTPSITERIQPVDTGDGGVLAVHFLGSVAMIVQTEEAVLRVVEDGGVRRIPVHGGGILATDANAQAVVTGGDDGKVMTLDADGEAHELAADGRRRWIDQVAASPGGAVAWTAGKAAYALSPGGETRSLDLPSSGGGLAFAPKGFRLAVAHYNGATLWFPNAAATPEFLEWKGSHLGASFSPDGKFLVTSMQEPMLHGWRLADSKHMRMSGYSTRVRSWSWSADGHWLATSGSEQLILWPFHGKDGPMGKTPKMFAPSEKRVTAVACHPSQEVVAVGYADGLLLLVRISDGAEVLARHADGQELSALAWSQGGGRLAFATVEGSAGIVPL